MKLGWEKLFPYCKDILTFFLISPCCFHCCCKWRYIQADDRTYTCGNLLNSFLHLIFWLWLLHLFSSGFTLTLWDVLAATITTNHHFLFFSSWICFLCYKRDCSKLPSMFNDPSRVSLVQIQHSNHCIKGCIYTKIRMTKCNMWWLIESYLKCLSVFQNWLRS